MATRLPTTTTSSLTEMRELRDPHVDSTPLPQIDLDRDDPAHIDDVLDRADALLLRHRELGTASSSALPPVAASVSATPPTALESLNEFPVLTEVVAAPRKPPTAQDLMLDEIEDELRLELLTQLSTELERSIEVAVHTRLEAHIQDIMQRTRDRLVTEVRRALRESLDEVIGGEIKRLKQHAKKKS